MRGSRCTLLAATLLLAACQSPTAETYEVSATLNADGAIDIANTTSHDWLSLSVEPCERPEAATQLGALARWRSVQVRVHGGCYDVRRTFEGGWSRHRIEVAPGETYVFRLSPVRVTLTR